MNETPHVLCALNPQAGSGIAMERWPKVMEMLRAFGVTHELLAGRDMPLSEQVERHLDQRGVGHYSAIVGIGGDGTHSIVINALMRLLERQPELTLPPYILIPMGTGNDIAKSFGLFSRERFFLGDLRRAVAAIRYGADYRIDLVRLPDRYFVDAMTIGLDSTILREHNLRKQEMARYPLLPRLIKGNLLYTWCAGARFWNQRILRVSVMVDDKPWYEGPIINLVINNTRVYGGEFVISPDAYANDGLLEVMAFTGRTDYLAKYLLSFRTNPRQIQEMAQRLSKVATRTQGRTFRIELDHAEAAQCDGEELPPQARFEMRVVPRAFLMKLPAEPP